MRRRWSTYLLPVLRYSTSSSSNYNIWWTWLTSVRGRKWRMQDKMRGWNAVQIPLLRNRFNSLISSYEDLIGIRQVKDAQRQVIQVEVRFGEAQESRRGAQRELNNLEIRLREVRYDLERTPRGEQHYLDLVKREMELIREERVLRDTFQRQEKEERDLFGTLSSALRASHEKERAQSEKTKYWSVVGSIIGAIVGIVGTSITSRLKMNELKSLVKTTAASRAEVEVKFTNSLAQLTTLVSNLEQKFDSLIDSGRDDLFLNSNVQSNNMREFLSVDLLENHEKQMRRNLFMSTSIMCAILLISVIMNFK